MSVEIVPIGDSAITITFGNEIDESTHHQINQFLQNFRRNKIDGVIECVPTYTSIAIFYDPAKVEFSQLVKNIYSIYESSMESSPQRPIVYRIPVYYGGESGPDLRFVAEFNNISEQEVINLHSDREYLIYMIGFVPGSVGIGGNQTGIYPTEVPSGWRIIGITPLSLFDIKNDKPSQLSAGNYVTFFPVNYEEFLTIKECVATKKYEVLTYKKGAEKT